MYLFVSADNLRMQASLVSALSLPKETVERDYSAILWGVDRLGRSVSIPSSSETLHEVLRQNSFSIVSACYPAGFSYKWKRGCPYPEETAKPVRDKETHCLFICLFVYLFVCLSVCLFVCFVCLFAVL